MNQSLAVLFEEQYADKLFDFNDEEKFECPNACDELKTTIEGMGVIVAEYNRKPPQERKGQGEGAQGQGGQSRSPRCCHS